MKLKLDENLSHRLKGPLAALGHDVSTAAEEGLLGSDDTVVAQAALGEQRMLLTLDLEFGNLNKYPAGTHPGIVVFGPTRRGPINVGRFVVEKVSRGELAALARRTVIVEPGRTRVRRADASTPP